MKIVRHAHQCRAYKFWMQASLPACQPLGSSLLMPRPWSALLSILILVDLWLLEQQCDTCSDSYISYKIAVLLHKS